jgi:hypothetical protein
VLFVVCGTGQSSIRLNIECWLGEGTRLYEYCTTHSCGTRSAVGSKFIIFPRIISICLQVLPFYFKFSFFHLL